MVQLIKDRVYDDHTEYANLDWKGKKIGLVWTFKKLVMWVFSPRLDLILYFKFICFNIRIIILNLSLHLVWTGLKNVVLNLVLGLIVSRKLLFPCSPDLDRCTNNFLELIIVVHYYQYMQHKTFLSQILMHCLLSCAICLGV